MHVKKAVLFIMMTLQVLLMQAQFSKANLQATGLTCALCSNAINKALKQLPFVESVKADIKNSSFSIVFREGVEVNPDAIKDAVEGAGFFVGGLAVTGSFKNLNTGPDGMLKIGTHWFRFITEYNQVLNGEVTLTLQDKSFLTAKAFKKISSTVKVPSLSTGKAETDQVKAGVKKGERIYHVTI
jgi:copper chaperone CopZ